jgi:hypothetical protein
MIISFKEWLNLLEVESGIHAFLKQHPSDTTKFFVVIYGNTKPIKDDLKEMGFKWFQGTWSTRSDFVTDEKKERLRELGVDLSGLSQSVIVANKNDTQGQSATQVQASNTDNMLNQMNQVVDAAKEAETNAESKRIFEELDRQIERLAASTDEAAKQEFIQAFLKFSSRFHNYSFANQLLIWIQTRGRASSVAGAKRWQEMGRTVVDWSKPIKIWAPISKKINKEIDDPTTGEKEIKTQNLTFFRLVSVYDVDATQAIPGHPNVFKPLTRKDWSVDSNEDIEELNVLVNATLNFIRNSQIDFDYEELDDELGGYSAGGKVRINDKFKGINAFSTIVHELAHEILHQKDKEKSKATSRQEKEIEAESTSFIVLNHFGFETKDAPNYLALWRASGQNVRDRAQQISLAARTIIDGIKGEMENVELSLNDDED